jgi:hypothetical protein
VCRSYEINRHRLGPGNRTRPPRAAANDLVGKPDADVREALGSRFPKHIYHIIVCIGALVAHREVGCWAVDALGAPHVGERPEKQLIRAFCDKVAELTPRHRRRSYRFEGNDRCSLFPLNPQQLAKRSSHFSLLCKSF